MLTLFRIASSRARGWFRQRRRDAELGDEIQAHLDLLTDEYVRRGMARDAARAAARREFGGVEHMKDTYRDQRGFPFVDILSNNIAYTSFGSEPFTPNNELRYNTFQAQDSFTRFGKNHSMTFGVCVCGNAWLR